METVFAHTENKKNQDDRTLSNSELSEPLCSVLSLIFSGKMAPVGLSNYSTTTRVTVLLLTEEILVWNSSWCWSSWLFHFALENYLWPIWGVFVHILWLITLTEPEPELILFPQLSKGSAWKYAKAPSAGYSLNPSSWIARHRSKLLI